MSGATSWIRGAITIAMSATMRNQEFATVTSMPATVPSRNVPRRLLRRARRDGATRRDSLHEATA